MQKCSRKVATEPELLNITKDEMLVAISTVLVAISSPSMNLISIVAMCGSKKYPYPPMEGHWKFQGGGGSQQPKFITESMKQLEIPGGREGSNKNLPWGRYGYFPEPHVRRRLNTTKSSIRSKL